MHAAAEQDNLSLFKYLFEVYPKGMDQKFVNDLTPADVAVEHNAHKIIQFLCSTYFPDMKKCTFLNNAKSRLAFSTEMEKIQRMNTR